MESYDYRYISFLSFYFLLLAKSIYVFTREIIYSKPLYYIGLRPEDVPVVKMLQTVTALKERDILLILRFGKL